MEYHTITSHTMLQEADGVLGLGTRESAFIPDLVEKSGLSAFSICLSRNGGQLSLGVLAHVLSFVPPVGFHTLSRLLL